MKKLITSLLLGVLMLSCSNYGVFPKPQGYVNDFADVLNTEEEAHLKKMLVWHERETTNEVVIVTLDSLYGFTNLDSCSLNMANTWGVGKKNLDNGVLIALAPKLRSVHIQVGKGLESKLTNQEAKRIIDSVMIPNFKSMGYMQGLSLGTEAMIEEIK